jgi:hypothetical protein
MSSLQVDDSESGGRKPTLDLREGFSCGSGFFGFGIVGYVIWRSRRGIPCLRSQARNITHAASLQPIGR